MGTLTTTLVRDRAAEYETEEPFDMRERDHLDTFPDALAAGDLHWRDTEWVVRWYFRRYLGEYPHADRTAIEDTYAENGFDVVRDALADAVASDDPETAVRRLTTLEGVDVRVASAFLAFFAPESHVAVGTRTWAALHDAGELGEPYPEELRPDDYVAYLETCRELSDRLDCSLWTLYRALWRLGAAEGA
jgi:hypothetical protein